MHYNKDKPKNEFLDSLASNSYLPYIIQSNRHTCHFRTLIHDILSNVILKDTISGNITATIGDHVLQFLISSNIFPALPSNKLNVFETDFQILIRELLCWTTLISSNLLRTKSFAIFCGNILWTCFNWSVLSETIKDFKASICFSVSFFKGVAKKEYVNLVCSVVSIHL